MLEIEKYFYMEDLSTDMQYLGRVTHWDSVLHSELEGFSFKPH